MVGDHFDWVIPLRERRPCSRRCRSCSGRPRWAIRRATCCRSDDPPHRVGL